MTNHKPGDSLLRGAGSDDLVKDGGGRRSSSSAISHRNNLNGSREHPLTKFKNASLASVFEANNDSDSSLDINSDSSMSCKLDRCRSDFRSQDLIEESGLSLRMTLALDGKKVGALKENVLESLHISEKTISEFQEILRSKTMATDKMCIYFQDGSYKHIEMTIQSTVADIIPVLLKKNFLYSAHIDEFALHEEEVRFDEASQSSTILQSRRLLSDESPISVQLSWTSGSNMRFTLRKKDDEIPDLHSPNDSSEKRGSWPFNQMQGIRGRTKTM